MHLQSHVVLETKNTLAADRRSNFSPTAPTAVRPCKLPITLILGIVFAASAMAQDPPADQAPEPSPEIHVEEDPTKPILFSVRNEYRNLRNGAWANTVLARVDKLSFRNIRNKGGMKGMIFRLDVPWNTVNAGGITQTGLGDVYGQVLYVPHVTRKFAFAVGSGVVLPTATDDRLGQGKLILAPAAAPVWYFANRKRIALIRFQNFVSVAGKSSRPDVNFFVADPVIVHPLNRKWWIGANTELKWDWRRKKFSGITGFQVGRMVHGKFGFWIKPEVPWGPGRTGNFTMKLTLFRVR